MKKWKTIKSSVVYSNKLFRIRSERCRIPRTGKHYDYYYEDSPDWVNVVPLTGDNHILLIRQYRHAVREFTLEIPGGIIDPSDPSPLKAARRELLEETGYSSGRFKLIGKCQPNPAIINNITYTYLARGIEPTGEQVPDSTEEIEVVKTPLRKIPDLINSGKIRHTLVITALYFARDSL